MITLLLSTRNAHKISEIRSILGSAATCLSLREYPAAPEVVEDAGTFVGNATKKAVALASWLASFGKVESETRGNDFYVLADDSGLEVDALNGAPGVHSARFAHMESGTRG